MKDPQRSWKKVYLSDLKYIVAEMKETIGRPICLILTGEVGAGKTTFVQAFCESLGGGEALSPTYSVVSDYRHLVHADFYRIESPEEIVHLELPLYMEEKEYLLVEWGKKFYHQLRKELPEFHFMELVIDVNEEKETGKVPSRNYSLFPLD